MCWECGHPGEQKAERIGSAVAAQAGPPRAISLKFLSHLPCDIQFPAEWLVDLMGAPAFRFLSPFVVSDSCQLVSYSLCFPIVAPYPVGFASALLLGFALDFAVHTLFPDLASLDVWFPLDGALLKLRSQFLFEPPKFDMSPLFADLAS
jgi:hypothetical protein